jgi:hypothetical protein
MNQPAQVQEKAPKPAGLLPKHVQSWLLISLALVMVMIMWLTGGKKPTRPARGLSPLAPVEAPIEVNETKIAELQNRIQELQREQLVAQSALAQQNRVIGARAQDPQHPDEPSAVGNPSAERTEDPIEVEQKKRAYLSLFASNVALSYRKPAAGSSPPESETDHRAPRTQPAGSDTAQIAQLLKEVQ